MLQGEKSTSIGSYTLPITDVDEKRRNFSGYQCNQYFNLADLQQHDTSGTTATDTVTSPRNQKGYASGNTKINQTAGKQFPKR